MKKHRRAYKKYDWRGHQIWLIFQRELVKLFYDRLDYLTVKTIMERKEE